MNQDIHHIPNWTKLGSEWKIEFQIDAQFDQHK